MPGGWLDSRPWSSKEQFWKVRTHLKEKNDQISGIFCLSGMTSRNNKGQFYWIRNHQYSCTESLSFFWQVSSVLFFLIFWLATLWEEEEKKEVREVWPQLLGQDFWDLGWTSRPPGLNRKGFSIKLEEISTFQQKFLLLPSSCSQIFCDHFVLSSSNFKLKCQCLFGNFFHSLCTAYICIYWSETERSNWLFWQFGFNIVQSKRK